MAAAMCAIAPSPALEARAPMRVWVVDRFAYTPWYTAELAESLGRAGAEVTLVSSEPEREPGYLAKRGLPARPGPLDLSRLTRWLPSGARKLARFTEAAINLRFLKAALRHPATRPDAVHLQQLPLLRYGLRSDLRFIRDCQRHAIPVVHTVHNLVPHGSGSRHDRIYAELYHLVDQLVVHSQPVAESLVARFSVPPSRITVIPHGPLFAPTEPVTAASTASARRRLGLPQDRIILLFQGIFAGYKGVDLLLQAWPLALRSLGAGTRQAPLLLLCGSGNAAIERSILDQARRHPETIRADLGYIPSTAISDYYAAADILVYPYRDITTSGALLTGACFNKPIIASDLPPFREFLEHGVNALLTVPADAQALSTAIAALISSALSIDPGDALYNGLVERANGNRARLCDWGEIAEHTLALYQAVLRHYHSSSPMYANACTPGQTGSA